MFLYVHWSQVKQECSLGFWQCLSVYATDSWQTNGNILTLHSDPSHIPDIHIQFLSFKYLGGKQTNYRINATTLSPDSLCPPTDDIKCFLHCCFTLNSNWNLFLSLLFLWRSIAPTQQSITITNFINSAKAVWAGEGLHYIQAQGRRAPIRAVGGLIWKKKQKKQPPDLRPTETKWEGQLKSSRFMRWFMRPRNHAWANVNNNPAPYR